MNCTRYWILDTRCTMLIRREFGPHTFLPAPQDGTPLHSARRDLAKSSDGGYTRLRGLGRSKKLKIKNGKKLSHVIPSIQLLAVPISWVIASCH